jgi:HD-GYP domain-containing protein (c-di-GMP phosphodiesterase class II)
LQGEEIPIEARILALADAVDSMASDRPYRTALEPTHILDEVRRNAKLQFDPEIAGAFFRIIQREGITFICNSSSEIQNNDAILQGTEARTQVTSGSFPKL